MTADFHVLETTGAMPAWRYACELADKAYQSGKTGIYIHLDTQSDAERMDALLWTFRDDSFLPHQIYDVTRPVNAPLMLGYASQYPTYNEQPGSLLINLGRDIPGNHANFTNLIEIVFSEPSVQQFGRERFKRYRALGYQLNTHKLKTI